MSTLQSLPLYPSSQNRKNLSPSQLSAFQQNVANALQAFISLPPEKCDVKSTRNFLSSYLKDAALDTVQSLIWDFPIAKSAVERLIRKRVLVLAEGLARLSPGLELPTLVDLAIVYCAKNVSTVRSLFASAFKTSPELLDALHSNLLPAFIRMLSSPQPLGLYGIAKITYCMSALVRALPSDGILVFGSDEGLMICLANIYDGFLSNVVQSYGGFPNAGNPDSWERIYMECKVSIIDTFHVILTTLLEDIAKASRSDLALKCEKLFGALFRILDSNTASTATTSQTPFLNRTLLADYQHSYDLSRTLSKALHRVAEEDARLDAINSTLLSLDTASTNDPGILKILLRSSGMPVNQNQTKAVDKKGKGRAAIIDHSTTSASTSSVSVDSDIDLKVAQVLDILPDHSPEYIKALLLHLDYPYSGNPEKVIESLLEGTAPSEEDLTTEHSAPAQNSTSTRKNVFDNQPIDLSQTWVGKKTDSASTVIQDMTFLDQMKADILRRAEDMAKEEEEEEYLLEEEKRRQSRVIVAYEELDLEASVKVAGDGEQTDGEDEDGDSASPSKQSPETILELAYLRDTALFSRDAQTRRSKARADLKAQTNWGDEQIEGWKIMLDKNPLKDKILAKHEFSGNRDIPHHSDASGPSNNRERGGHISRGSHGRGRGGESKTRGGSSSGDTRGRARKEKRGNQSRTRGHDKKMQRAGIPS